MWHVDLFSGIGGFALAAKVNRVETSCFVEKDPRCQDFLSKAWPGVPIYDDIKTFNGKEHQGAWLLTAGVPCQPASRAGKQRGAADDRWLWPDALRILGEVRPTWCLFENPPGIGDVGLAGILADVEAQGYELPKTEDGKPVVYGIPACAVGAPHRRMRYWIVAHRSGMFCDRIQNYKGGRGKGLAGIPEFGNSHGETIWPSGYWEMGKPDVLCMVDGVRPGLCSALGNSIVWPVAAKLIKAMICAR